MPKVLVTVIWEKRAPALPKALVSVIWDELPSPERGVGARAPQLPTGAARARGRAPDAEPPVDPATAGNGAASTEISSIFVA